MFCLTQHSIQLNMHMFYVTCANSTYVHTMYLSSVNILVNGMYVRLHLCVHYVCAIGSC